MQLTAKQERALGHVMMQARIHEGWTPKPRASSNSTTDNMHRALVAMDGGSMLKRDVLALADIGATDAMARAIDRMVAGGLVEVSDYRGDTLLTCLPEADKWLAENGRQGVLW